FYDRIAGWVAPGGTLLIVGHRHIHSATGPPVEASATVAAITARLDQTGWTVVTAEESRRMLAGRGRGRGGGEVALHDVVVRATRRD
ncbi:MAG TPA: SAM-dependent methyltransferase, partial [Micromonosporaceae bacterium]